MAGLADSEAWRTLTTQPEKFRLFTHDSAFRESWRAALAQLGPDAAWYFQRLGVLTVKPDALLSGRLPECLEFLAGHGFVPVQAVSFAYTRAMTRELWRYQWNIATLDRLSLSDLLHQRQQSITLVLADVTGGPIPASSRLATLKGSAFPAAREDWHLRTILGAPNRLMVLVHCPDEPIDIVRELGVAFSPEQVRRLYEQWPRILASGVANVVPAELPRPPAARYTLDAEQAAEAVRRQLASAGGEAVAADRAAAMLRSARDGSESLDWASWQRELRLAGVDTASWNVLLAASQYIRHDIPGGTCVVSGTGRRLWMNGEGRMLLEQPEPALVGSR
jgi:hypothetical protein